MIYGILACDLNGGVGVNQRLPWPMLKQDMDRFRRLTELQIVVMGRNTFESLRRPLKNRLNIVLTRNAPINPIPCSNVIYTTLEPLWELLQEYRGLSSSKHVYIIGGPEVWRQFLPLIDIVYMTRVMSTFKCDTSVSLALFKDTFPKVIYESCLHHHPTHGFGYYFEARTRLHCVPTGFYEYRK